VFSLITDLCSAFFTLCTLIRAFQDQYKQTTIDEFSNEHNKVKNPNRQEEDQLAIYKPSREVELGATENNIS